MAGMDEILDKVLRNCDFHAILQDVDGKFQAFTV